MSSDFDAIELETVSLADISSEWDELAPYRSRQIQEGDDLSYSLVLKPLILRYLEQYSPPSPHVLDVGCGIGDLTGAIAPQAASVVGIDASRSSIAIACEVNGGPNMTYEHCSLRSHADDNPERYDIVVASMVLQTCPDVQAALNQVHSSLKPGGLLLATITHPCFWPRYWGYDDTPWFRYESEIAIRGRFRISLEQTALSSTHFHRPLSKYLQALHDSGFALTALHEPFPEVDSISLFPQPWTYPRFLAFVGSAQVRRDEAQLC